MYHFWLFFFLLTLGPSLSAAQFALILSSDDPAYREFASSIKSTLPAGAWQLGWEGNVERFEQSPPSNVDLVITAGITATRAALHKENSPPVIASLLTRTAFDTIKRDTAPHRNGSSAIYLDQPVTRQLAFINKLLPVSVFENRHIFTLVSDPKSEPLSALRQTASSAGFKLTSAITSGRDSSVSDIEHLISNKEGIFLALPDGVVFARDNIRPFLLTTYRYKIPVIAFSLPFVQAGALAALHTTPAQFGQEIAQTIAKLPTASPSTSLPPPRSPSQYSISINQQVARSFKLTLPSESEVLAALRSSQGDRP